MTSDTLPTITASIHLSKFDFAISAIFSISFLSCATATGGVLNKRSSKKYRCGSFSSTGFFFSGIIFSLAFTIRFVNGKNITVATTLKKRWNIATCNAGALNTENIFPNGTQMLSIPKMITPTVL